MNTQIKNISELDWESYYKKGKEALKKELESNSEMWERWTNSDKRYMLVSSIQIIENDINKTCGRTSGYIDCHISSNNIEDLRLLWKSEFIKQRYDTTKQHFIADIKDKKIVEFLSVCM